MGLYREYTFSTSLLGREAVLSRHTSTALSMVAAFASAAALGIYSRSSRLSCGFGQAVRWPGARPSVAAPGQARRESHLAGGYSHGAAWRSRPSGPIGLDVPAAYGPLRMGSARGARERRWAGTHAAPARRLRRRAQRYSRYTSTLSILKQVFSIFPLLRGIFKNYL